MRDLADALQLLLGLDREAHDLSVWQMAARAAVVYVVTVAMVRLGKKRFMGRATAFDVIIGIILGSIISRAITGNSPFFAALAAAAVLIAMHWLFSLLAVHWHGLGTLVKGHPRLLVRDGVVDRAMMRKSHISDGDLAEDLRSSGIRDLGEVAEAHLERSGKVSVIKARKEPRVVEISVADGVKTVRLEIG